MFDAITGKAYSISCSLFTGWSDDPFYSGLDPLPDDLAFQRAYLSEETLAQVEPHYQAAVTAAKAVDPAAFVEQIMPQLGWQVETMETSVYSSWPDTFAEYWRQSMGRRQEWQWIVRLDITTGDGSRWIAWYNTIKDCLLELFCLGQEGSLPEGYVLDRYCMWSLLQEGAPVPESPYYDYLLQGADGLWYDVTFLSDKGLEKFLQDRDFHAADYLNTMSWLAPGEDGYSYRLLSDGTTEAAG